MLHRALTVWRKIYVIIYFHLNAYNVMNQTLGSHTEYTMIDRLWIFCKKEIIWKFPNVKNWHQTLFTQYLYSIDTSDILDIIYAMFMDSPDILDILRNVYGFPWHFRHYLRNVYGFPWHVRHLYAVIRHVRRYSRNVNVYLRHFRHSIMIARIANAWFFITFRRH